MTEQVWAIIPAAGEGTRFSNRRDKLMIHLDGLPILVRTVETLLNAQQVRGATILAHADQVRLYQRMLQEYGHRKPATVIEGGATRRESVYLGLQAVPADIQTVLVHDAARPVFTPKFIDETIDALRAQPQWVGVIRAAAETDTIKQIASESDLSITATVNRTLLWRAQTPQVFQKEALIKAHQQVPQDAVVTDDAQLIELSGTGTVGILPSPASNLKITTPEDLFFAETYLAVHPTPRR